MTRTTMTAAVAALALTSMSMAPRQADAAISSLSECYNAVLTWCNANFPNADCSNSSGLDECDEEFGDTSASRNPGGIKILTGGVKRPTVQSDDREAGGSGRDGSNR